MKSKIIIAISELLGVTGNLLACIGVIKRVESWGLCGIIFYTIALVIFHVELMAKEQKQQKEIDNLSFLMHDAYREIIKIKYGKK